VTSLPVSGSTKRSSVAVQSGPPLGQRFVAPALDQQTDDQDQTPPGHSDRRRTAACDSQHYAAGDEQAADDIEHRAHHRALHSGIGSITAAVP
jgi:hypothetical protein